jgi:hypothetical protein
MVTIYSISGKKIIETGIDPGSNAVRLNLAVGDYVVESDFGGYLTYAKYQAIQ